jgi:hypothetical protein
LLSISILAPAFVVWWWCFVPIRYNFDATTAQSPAAFGWTAPSDNITHTAFEFRTRPRLKIATIKLPKLPAYTEPSASDMYLHVENGRPQSFILQSTPVTQGEALDRVRYWGKLWNFDVSKIEEWRNQVRHKDWGRFAAGHVATRPEPGDVDVWLEVWPISPDNDVWYVAFNIYWHSDRK